MFVDTKAASPPAYQALVQQWRKNAKDYSHLNRAAGLLRNIPGLGHLGTTVYPPLLATVVVVIAHYLEVRSKIAANPLLQRPYESHVVLGLSICCHPVQALGSGVLDLNEGLAKLGVGYH
jgi:hypothetical protein